MLAGPRFHSNCSVVLFSNHKYLSPKILPQTKHTQYMHMSKNQKKGEKRNKMEASKESKKIV